MHTCFIRRAFRFSDTYTYLNLKEKGVTLIVPYVVMDLEVLYEKYTMVGSALKSSFVAVHVDAPLPHSHHGDGGTCP